ncbi:MAG: M48 family metallopeptidase [Alphaproteobacteria bacterium]|nr:M48 family metallopeptidase [Alphaproteobacteria bacterium]
MKAELFALSLEIVDAEDIVHARWPLAEIHLADGAEPALRLKCGHDDAARLVLSDPTARDAFKRACPNLLRVSPPVARSWSKLVLWGSFAVAGLASALFVLVPFAARSIARTIPIETEKRMGAEITRQVIGQLQRQEKKSGDVVCKAAPGRQAVERLMVRLTPQSLDGMVEITVIDLTIVNAFTLPGGQILLFRGLIDLTETPEELAGVLGHEMGHVFYHHVLELALQGAGTAALIGLLVGDVTGGTVIAGLGQTLLQASYGRDAERAADAFAIDQLASAGIDGKGVATLFDRMEKKDPGPRGILALIMSHPLTPERKATARANARPGGAAMSPEDWRAIKRMCET